uniref:Ubiquitin-like domain-containing protein n=1 Tax=Glycine max TaxID=3847 RepID=A0A0R0HI53_SOYBN
MEANSGASEPNSNATIITINVKFGGVSIPISISPHLTINGFKSLLLPSTNVLPRGQKLIFKDATDGPVWKKAQVVPKSRKDDSGSNNDMKKIPVKNRMERWKATGVVALSECNLEVIPDEVWVCGSSARVLDCNNNSITDVPDEIARLTGLDKLFINANEIVDKSIRWEGLTTLKYLTVLSLNHNNLTTLSSTLGSLTSLRELHVSNNKLSGLPNEIRHLTQLEVLRANNNRLFSKKNKALYLGNTRMKSLPSKLFKTCLQLSTLDLHNTKITIDLLRRFEGWDNFDECQRSKHQKQIDFRVGVSRDFDEGVDKN